MNKGTQFTPSPRRLTFEHTQQRSSKSTNIRSIDDLDDGILVNFAAKVMTLSPPRDVSTGILQEATLIDETGSITMTIWNTNVDKLKESLFYEFKDVTVITFRNEKRLNYSYQSLHLEREHINVPIEEDVKPTANDHVQLIGIQSFNVHYWCINCDSRLEIENAEMTCCEKCQLLQFVQYCQSQVTCKFLFQIDDDSRRHVLLDGSKETFESLMKFTSNKDSVITSESATSVMRSTFGQKFRITYIGHILNDIAML